jgi:hypothetical protein
MRKGTRVVSAQWPFLYPEKFTKTGILNPYESLKIALRIA